MKDVPKAIEAVWKIESTRLIAAIARVTHDIGIAEELVQDALVTALERWPEEGIPDNPGAWLMTAAKRCAIDSPNASSTTSRVLAHRRSVVSARELAVPLPLPTAHYQLLGLLLSRSDLTVLGLSWLSGHCCGDSSGEGIVPGARCPTNAAAVGRFKDARFARNYSVPSQQSFVLGGPLTHQATPQDRSISTGDPMRLSFALPVLALAIQLGAQPSPDENAVRNIIRDETDAWNRGDAVGYSRHFAAAGTFTNIRGQFFTGHPAFLKQHEVIFAGIFKNSRVSQDIVSLNFIRPDVAIIETLTTLAGMAQSPPGVARDDKGRMRTRLLQVVAKEGGVWKIVTYHNVDVKPGTPVPEPG